MRVRPPFLLFAFDKPHLSVSRLSSQSLLHYLLYSPPSAALNHVRLLPIAQISFRTLLRLGLPRLSLDRCTYVSYTLLTRKLLRLTLSENFGSALTSSQLATRSQKIDSIRAKLSQKKQDASFANGNKNAQDHANFHAGELNLSARLLSSLSKREKG